MKQKLVKAVFIKTVQSRERGSRHFTSRIQPELSTLSSVRWIDSDVAKRGFDIIGAGIALLFFLPIFVLIIAAIGLLHGRPIFYKHRRIGRGSRMFPCLKFRTMHTDADRRLAACLSSDPARQFEWEQVQKLRCDPRILGIGRILRKSSLDELPQLINVLRGEMSLVGPRPIVADEVVKYGKNFNTYIGLRPGITGLWQVSGRNNTTYEERVALDMRYAKERTMLGDLSILLRTVTVIVTGHGAY